MAITAGDARATFASDAPAAGKGQRQSRTSWREEARREA